MENEAMRLNGNICSKNKLEGEFWLIQFADSLHSELEGRFQN